jgi:hypothetical protein
MRCAKRSSPRRTGHPADSLYPLAVGRATLATCRAAHEMWASKAGSVADLTVYLDAGRRALCAGFSDEMLLAKQNARSRAVPRRRATGRTVANRLTVRERGMDGRLGIESVGPQRPVARRTRVSRSGQDDRLIADNRRVDLVVQRVLG